jgi:DNA-binding response OmpR family regulator
MTEKILIVDDDVDTLKLVGLMLERQGYDISVANNGAQGIRKAAAEVPDLILLDVMMPDMDGYEVTQRLRSEPALAHIPIVMFTAKSMVDDKVAGFEAGVDDYLTKPTHPAELTAHVKAVLARAVQANSEVPTSEKGVVVGFLGARGGLGTTTLAINTAIALQRAGQDVIVAEMDPGRSSLRLDLGIDRGSGLSNLLTRSLKDIHLRSIDAELVNHKSKVRLLLGDFRPGETELGQAIPQMEAIVNNLSAMATLVILDLGAGLQPYVKPLLEICDRLVLIVEPVFPTNRFAMALVDELEASGFGRHKIYLTLLTKTRTSLQIPWRQLQADLGVELLGVIPPAAEQAHQAAQSGTPLIMAQTEGLIVDQLLQLADHLSSSLQPVRG